MVWLIPKHFTTKSHLVQVLESIEQILPPPHIFAIYLTFFALNLRSKYKLRLYDLLQNSN